MKKKAPKKLSLNRETLHQLSDEDAMKAVGGTCSPTDSCTTCGHFDSPGGPRVG